MSCSFRDICHVPVLPDPARLMSPTSAWSLLTHLAKAGRVGSSDQSHGAKKDREAVKTHG